MKYYKYHEFRFVAVNVLLATFIFLMTDCNAQSTPKRALLALSKANHTLAIVDPVTLTIVASIPIGVDPHELVALADG